MIGYAKSIFAIALSVVVQLMPSTAMAETLDELYARGVQAARNGDRATCVNAFEAYLSGVGTISVDGRRRIEGQIRLCRGTRIEAMAANRIININGRTMQNLLRMSRSITHVVE